MNRNEFNTGMAALLAGFAYAQDKTTRETEDVYYELLKDIPNDIWIAGVKKALATSTYFPSIRDLGVACFGETVEHTEERCDPLRSKQNYQVRIPAVTWQENMQRVIAERTALPEPPKPKQISRPRSDPKPAPFDAREYLARTWKMQQDAGIHGYNYPDWYDQVNGTVKAEIDDLVDNPPF